MSASAPPPKDTKVRTPTSEVVPTPQQVKWRDLLWSKQAAAAIVLGVAASIAVELCKSPVEPVLRWLSRVLTFGSAYLRDQPYAVAARDPTNDPAMLAGFLILSCMVLGLSGLAIAGGTTVYEHRSKLQRLVAKLRGEPDADADKDTEAALKRETAALARSIRHTIMIFWGEVVMAVGLLCFIFQTYIADARAVSIWREFHADLRICAPYMKPESQLQLESRFAQVRTRADYIALLAELRPVAVEHCLTLYADAW